MQATSENPTARQARWPTWMREPLLHFVLIGAALFAIDHAFVLRQDDPRLIVIDAAVDRQAIDVFKSARGREPNDEELYALRRVWLDNEVLYREGLAMQVDKGDSAIRERVIFKALSMVDAGTKRPDLDEQVLRNWFERNRGRYDEPARYDFQEAVLGGGDTSEATLGAFAAALNAGTPGDARAGLRVFKGRPHANVVQSYGVEFASALEKAPIGQWRVLPSREGPRVMRLEAVSQPQAANFESLRGVVLQDWTDAVLAEQRSAAVRALARKYVVKTEAKAP